MQEAKPIEIVGGMPALEPTLRWRHDCEVYVMGVFAGLQLGPDALNLAGARTGAARIDHALHAAVRHGVMSTVVGASAQGDASGAGGSGDRVAPAASRVALPAVGIESIAVKLASSGWVSVNIHDTAKA